MRGLRPLVLALAALAVASPARASELISLDISSRLVPGESLRANVLLPDGYARSQRYPVLYLLHGFGETFGTWADPARGDVQRLARGFPGLIVMPDQRGGYSTDHYNGGRRGDPAWTAHWFQHIIPLVSERFQIRRSRRWHAIAGFSMGGMGAVLLASQRPDYFGSAVSMSGALNIQRQEFASGSTVLGADFEAIWGPPNGEYATGHNPTRLVENLASTRLLTLTGDGVPGEHAELGDPVLFAGGTALEREIRLHNEDFARAAMDAGVALEYRVRPGVHDWPDVRDNFAEALDWGLFGVVKRSPARWTYRTIRETGRAWHVRYEFAEPPARLARFRYADNKLSGTGAGVVTVRSARCSFTAELPFRRRC